MRLKELSIELRNNRIVSRHTSGEGYQFFFAILKVPKNTVVSIILKWKMFGTTKTHSQDNTGVASGQVSECPSVAQPVPGLENSSNAPQPPWQKVRGSAEKNGRLPKSRCAKRVASYPIRLESDIAAKGASTKSSVKSLNTYVNGILTFFTFLKTCFCFVIMGYCA